VSTRSHPADHSRLPPSLSLIQVLPVGEETEQWTPARSGRGPWPCHDPVPGALAEISIRCSGAAPRPASIRGAARRRRSLAVLRSTSAMRSAVVTSAECARRVSGGEVSRRACRRMRRVRRYLVEEIRFPVEQRVVQAGGVRPATAPEELGRKDDLDSASCATCPVVPGGHAAGCGARRCRGRVRAAECARCEACVGLSRLRRGLRRVLSVIALWKLHCRCRLVHAFADSYPPCRTCKRIRVTFDYA